MCPLNLTMCSSLDHGVLGVWNDANNTMTDPDGDGIYTVDLMNIRQQD